MADRTILATARGFVTGAVVGVLVVEEEDDSSRCRLVHDRDAAVRPRAVRHGPMIDRHGRVVGINVADLTSLHGSVDAADFALPLGHI